MGGSGTCLGIDLGGARMDTTGYVLLEGDARPRVVAAGHLSKATSADEAERRLLELIDEHAPAVVAVDAPLTLPPCLTCPPYCRGPGVGLCELHTADRVWEIGGNPVTERLCEVRLRGELQSGPLPTMRIGQIAARGQALARRLTAAHALRGLRRGPEVIEVYPYATLARLGQGDSGLRPRDDGEDETAFTDRVLAALAEAIDGIEQHAAGLARGHVRDALLAAYTGWLGPDGLEQPPPDFNVASGWIWLPRPEAA